MTEQRMKTALIALQWTLGLVILIEAILFVMPGARHDFARTHMPDLLRQVLGWGEIMGAVLLLIPRTVVRGAWVLVGIFVLAIIVHVLHGMFNVGSLAIYIAAAVGTRASCRRSGGRGRPPDSRRGRWRYWSNGSESMSNEELIRRFESDAVPEASFHHGDHVRLAFAYLCEYPVLNALERFASALKRFATARGKTQLYNETITCAYFFLIRERMAHCGGQGWEEFARCNPDLLVWKQGILTRYYRESTLKSDLARNVFVLPDKCLELPTSLLEVVPDQR